MAEQTIASRIQDAMSALSESHRRMADHALAHPFKVATMSIDEFAQQCGVSVATANRFARALGLPGYAQFRAELARGFEEALAPVERLRLERGKSASAADIFAASLYEDERNAEHTRMALSPEQCEQAVQAILRAERIFIIGFGSSGFLAGLLQRGLSQHCRMVESLAGPGGVSHAARQLSRLQPSDLVICIAFPRYLADTVTLAQAARNAGVTVLALTDKPSSPLVPLADICLYAATQRQLLSNSETAVLGLIEALSAAVAHQSQHSLVAAAQLAESVMPWLIYGKPRHD
ncbi:MurR/RpiR family transcriptional regulator [uncultured Castellaniella sp.]|jgi:DNA-binding MurR/RpiR family transcriptional regulator|uniref:MurR/RpiR family transcriptional regulator n=1 Tax=uncultured Castellaniella sp. TaxID=647907 RepID=UPI00262C4F19|nr:MurR/RpiR family transcriptional regulator [uncultured Castellaniella sp.]